jgi:DNA-binding response OmpR family regulator
VNPANAAQNHILMIDDDVDLNKLLTEYLARFGHRLATATTAARGLHEFTARGEIADRVLGLELGADDYLSKPFEPRELVARIQSVIRRSAQHGSRQVLVSDGLTLEKETRRVSLDGGDVELTTMEFELLQVLMESHGRVMSRNRLIERLRGIDADVYDRSIDMLVSRLRDKLGDDSQAPRFIRTVRLTGYQFVGKPGAGLQ